MTVIRIILTRPQPEMSSNFIEVNLKISRDEAMKRCRELLEKYPDVYKKCEVDE